MEAWLNIVNLKRILFSFALMYSFCTMAPMSFVLIRLMSFKALLEIQAAELQCTNLHFKRFSSSPLILDHTHQF